MELVDKKNEIDYNGYTLTELNELLDEFSKFIDDLEQYDFEYESGIYASRKHVEDILGYTAYMVGFVSNSLEKNPNLTEQQKAIMENILKRGMYIPTELSILLQSKFIEATSDMYHWNVNSKRLLKSFEHFTELREYVEESMVTPKLTSELANKYVPIIERYIDEMDEQRLELYEVKHQYQLAQDINKSCNRKYCIKYEKIFDREYEKLIQVESDLCARINEMEELLELMEQKLEKKEQHEFIEKWCSFMEQEVTVKKLKLYGEKLQHLKQKVEKNVKSYANTHKDEIIQKAKAIVKNDKNKKITAVIMAIALSGAAGAKLFNKNLSKESNVTRYEELDSKESISETVEDKTANNIGSEVIYEPYVVCVPKLRLRANPSTENNNILSELQENELVYIYNNSEEILNPYDTHNWRRAIYKFTSSDGNENLISGYVDADYLARNIDNRVCMVVPGNIDISAVNVDDIQYTVNSVNSEICVDEQER